METVRIDGVTIRVRDVRKAATFYRDVLGFRQTWSMDRERARGLWVGADSAALTLVQRPVRAMRYAEMEIVLQVANTLAMRSQLEAQGVTFDGETYMIEGIGNAAHFLDPDRNRFMLLDYSNETTRIALP